MVSVASGPSTPSPVSDSPSNESSSISQVNGRQRLKVHDPARDISIQVLEKFSLVTRFARETTSQLFRESHSNGFGAFEKRYNNQSVEDFSHKASNDEEKTVDEIPVAPDPLEVIFFHFVLSY